MEDNNMAVDMALWALVAAVVGFLACGCMITRKPTAGGHAPMRRQYGGGHG